MSNSNPKVWTKPEMLSITAEGYLIDVLYLCGQFDDTCRTPKSERSWNRRFIPGESVLHLAIVNEDPAMVKFLLDSGADYHERCVGNFMCPEDQKGSRTDSLDHEYVNLSPETNYEGWVLCSICINRSLNITPGQCECCALSVLIGRWISPLASVSAVLYLY